jgi:hypothetical protein
MVKEVYGKFFSIPPADLPVTNTRLIVEKPTDGAIEAREELIVPTVARPDT